MSATGLGVTFWQTAVPHVSTSGLMYLADRDYTITHVYLSNMSPTGASIDVVLGITFNGATMVLNDSRKFLKITLTAGQVFDLGTRIPLKAAWALMGTGSASYGDEMVWAGITGEVSD